MNCRRSKLGGGVAGQGLGGRVGERQPAVHIVGQHHFGEVLGHQPEAGFGVAGFLGAFFGSRFANYVLHHQGPAGVAQDAGVDCDWPARAIARHQLRRGRVLLIAAARLLQQLRGRLVKLRQKLANAHAQQLLAREAAQPLSRGIGGDQVAAFVLRVDGFGKALDQEPVLALPQLRAPLQFQHAVKIELPLRFGHSACGRGNQWVFVIIFRRVW